MATFYKAEGLTILLNPSATRLRALIARSGSRCLRGVIDEEGDFYVWDANHMVHSDLYFDFGITGLRLDVSDEAVSVVLAGGAHELMVPAEELENFFSVHGHPGSTLEDSGAIGAICDAACDQVLSHRSFIGRDPCSVVADIDPRLPHGQANLQMVREALEYLASRSQTRIRVR